MGNKLSLAFIEESHDFTSLRELGDDSITEPFGRYFQTFTLKWVKYFASKIATDDTILAAYGGTLDIFNSSMVICWKDYFRIIKDIREKQEIDMIVQQKTVWHPATIGYSMDSKERVDEIIKKTAVAKNDGKTDDYTDDEASDYDESDDDADIDLTEEEKEEKRKRKEDEKLYILNYYKGKKEIGRSINSMSSSSTSNPLQKVSDTKVIRAKEWDPTIYNPIYFGTSGRTMKEIDETVNESKNHMKNAEIRAIEMAKKSRADILNSMERSFGSHAAARQKQIDELEKKYNISKQKREDTLNKNKKELPGGAFKIFKLDWDNEYNAAEAAYLEEMGNLKFIHNTKTVIDQEMLVKKREDLDSFKEVESQELPSAERLESIARVEISRIIDEAEKCNIALDTARLDYLGLRKDLEKLNNVAAKKQANKQILNEINELKQIMVVSEKALRNRQKELQDMLNQISDAETLLDRSLRLRQQQEEILPLFRLLQVDSCNPDKAVCRLDLLMCCLTILMKSTFDQKFSFFLQLFDNLGYGSFDCKFLVKLLHLFGTSLTKMCILPHASLEEDTQSLVTRAFFDLGLEPQCDILTQYESKEFILQLISHSHYLVRIFGIVPGRVRKNMSTYQRNRMSALNLLYHGMIGPTLAKYRLHYECTRYRSELEPKQRQSMHEMALGMGESDALKVDFSKFVLKPGKKGSRRIDPLSHGHLMYWMYIDVGLRNEAATKMQALIRSYRGRKIAVLKATRKAFYEAKEAAIQEMKAKVMTEFRKREAVSGMAKMKWDAKVRMKQAKLNASGQAIARNEVVMVMVEEAINKARIDIEQRFNKIEEKEAFAGIKFDDNSEYIIDAPSKAPDIGALFGLVPKPVVIDSGTLGADGIATPRPDAIDTEGSSAGDHTVDLHPSSHMVVDRIQSIINGSYRASVHAKGETMNEVDLMYTMNLSYPGYDHLLNRFRALHEAVTLYKARELINELPSKRLFIKYVECNGIDVIVRDLLTHFKFTDAASVEAISTAFKAVAYSDIERGLMEANLKRMVDVVDGGLKALNGIRVEKELNDIDAMVRQRLAVSETIHTHQIIQTELDRVNNIFKRNVVVRDEILRDILLLRDKFKRICYSCVEVDKKRSFLVEFRDRKLLGITREPSVSVDERQSWMHRLANANLLPDDTIAQMEVKYGELRSTCKEFIDIAVKDAMIIISEMYQPKHLKTIQPIEEVQTHGRSISGRGLPSTSGKYYTYEAHSISYHICEDYHGMFDGSDEYASKALGKDVVYTLEYRKCHIPKLNVPLICNVDYAGFRIIATSKLPVERVTFNDDGEVRKVSDDFVLGLNSDGVTYINKNKALQAMLRLTAFKLNLAEHHVQAVADMASSVICCSTEIKAYKGGNDEYYLRDFWRSMPPEIPEDTPHLPRSPRDQTVLWRHLRPELVRIVSTTLSPDAASMMVYRQKDSLDHYKNLRDATRFLVSEHMLAFANKLVARDYDVPISEGLGINVEQELHGNGINMRHMGLLRSLMWKAMPGTIGINFSEAYVSTSIDVSADVNNGDTISFLNHNFKVNITPNTPIRPRQIPITETFLLKTVKGIPGWQKGSCNKSKWCESLRSVLLAEMVARATKSQIRLQLRVYLKKTVCVSYHMIVATVVEHLNILCSSTDQSSRYLASTLFPCIREKFGNCAVSQSECDMFYTLLQPCLIYLVKRLVQMMGVQLTLTCLSEFSERPIGFVFTALDVLEMVPMIKHNMPMLAHAEALLVELKAKEIEKQTYTQVVLHDQPLVNIRLSERKGSRTADNSGGSLGTSCTCYYSSGCELEQKGPIPTDDFTRSVKFSPGAKAVLDMKFHPSVVPQSSAEHFSIEIWTMCSGGADTLRVVYISGRYGLFASRDNCWTFQLVEGLYELYVKIAPIAMNRWTHIVVTYDGTTVRCYIDSLLKSSLETEAVMLAKAAGMKQDNADASIRINVDEESERDVVKSSSQAEAEAYFASKDGSHAMKKAAHSIMETKEFQRLNHGADAPDDASRRVAVLAAAIKQARTQYATDTYVRNVRDIAERYAALRQDLSEKIAKRQEEGMLRMRKGLRVGAGLADGNNKEGKNFYWGNASSLSVYGVALSFDQVREHYSYCVLDKSKDAQRMYAVASSKYEEAMLFAAEDYTILRGYAQSLCQYLKIEICAGTTAGVTKGKLSVLDAIDKFVVLNMPHGIAEVLFSVPKETFYADLVCAAFNSIMDLDSMYFGKGVGQYTRKDLVHLPMEYNLDAPTNDPLCVATAARMYQEVVRDSSLRFAYCEVDLQWITSIQSSQLIVALVRYAAEDSTLSMVKVGELFKSSTLEGGIPLTDEDVSVLCGNLVLSVGFDLTGCASITDDAVSYISRVRSLKVLTLDGCVLIDDKGLKHLEFIGEQLEVLSLSGCVKITDTGVCKLATVCRSLKVVDLSNNPFITHDSIIDVATNSSKITTLKVSACSISDGGFTAACSHLSRKFLTHLDISYNRDIGDGGIMALADACPNLKVLNLCSLSKITDDASRAIMSKCWYLESLNLEDVFMLSDHSFWFDRHYDGRPAADENMLKSLTFLSLKDCVNITPHSIEGLAHRCTNITTLTLRGCDKLGDKALIELTTPHTDKYPMCDAFKSIDLSYCASITAAGVLRLLPCCGCLEEIDLSGITTVDDAFLHSLCLVCPTIQKMTLHKCVSITDVGLCSLADYLWIEHLDVTGCTRITDDGIEVLTAVCNGILQLIVHRLHRLSDRSIQCIARNCKVIQLLNVKGCTHISTDALEDLRRMQLNCTVIV